ncbi:MAG TPA: hypothetical protein VMS09_13595 [Paenibacillus sp.]|uniref:hypothetical protein n=1 Tax=Paenibacillus sp. TaxID=58172 RepID=UPI002D099394|nr:hypothetical protein [Paenibacillus sp.]HUC93034.1 hypothetical protein [Paenibacillus sp.]
MKENHSFEKAYAAFIQRHLERRSGERKGRLERGHGHAERLFAENIWWPLKGNFDDLHPEFEVFDFRGNSYFGDYGYLPGYLKFIWEVKGFGPHVRDMDRKSYSKELNRETFLQAMGFRVVSFAYDDVAHRPEVCISLLRMLLGRFQPAEAPVDRAVLAEKEVLRLAVQLVRPIRPIDVAAHFRLNHRTAVGMLQSLCAKGWLRPERKGKEVKVLAYELVRGAWEYMD